MNGTKNILLTIITENQTQKTKAKKFAELIKKELDQNWKILSIEKYSKLEHSYKIELKKLHGEMSHEELKLKQLNIAFKLVSPWLLFYDETQNTLELIYYKKEESQFRKNEFNVFNWCQIQAVI
ncbi:MAG: hypothetical protein RLZZ546_1267 [Bacteroidota bacterium]